MKTAVLFGGSGFIGVFFAKYAIEKMGFSHVYLYDIAPLKEKDPFRINLLAEMSQNITFIKGDVRDEITWRPNEEITLIANFAAIHREPGHAPIEYYETNIKGAKNVCAFAEKVNCKNIVFTSSISVYGTATKPATETTTTVPFTPYGNSKLISEYIHIGWLEKKLQDRNLLIARPGVVFGPGEGGNVTRLIKSVLGGYFAFTGNKKTKKAGIYVEELCRAIFWCLNKKNENKNLPCIFNFGMRDPISLAEYVSAIKMVSSSNRFTPSFPLFIILISSYLLKIISKLLKINIPINPTRVRKTVRDNNIIPQNLISTGYCYKYSLVEAFERWKKQKPSDWGGD
ncbi:NAD(P)-dependent oxidoreductase [Thalassospira profundimaris]|uniref:NAD-dependent epimerase/dehydratase family protein n=1 Tax=Thalassospira profundimaris TaxID=502049 RepID=UPI0015F04DCF|nr:NAD(P)-dependent oxidoreductase [Thalassospira profundimaris]